MRDGDPQRAIEEFAAALDDLRRHAGAPSFARISSFSKKRRSIAKEPSPLPLPKSTASDAVQGKRLPTIATVLAFVESCQLFADDAGMITDPARFDLASWQHRWSEVRALRDGAQRPVTEVPETDGPKEDSDGAEQRTAGAHRGERDIDPRVLAQQRVAAHAAGLELEVLRDVPSAPGRLPVIGHGWRLRRDPVQFVVDLSSVGRIVRVDIGSFVVYVITDFDLLHRVLVENSDAYERGLLFERIRFIYGGALLAADGQLHRDLRLLLQPAFYRTALKNYAPTIKRDADALASSWRPGQIIEARSALLGLVIGSLLGSLFSHEPDAEELQHISGLIADIGAGAIVGSVLPKKLANLPTSVNRKFLSAGTQLRDYCQQLLVARRASGERRDDLVDLLLYSFGGHDKFLAEQAVTVLFGGIDAATAMLTWCLYEVSQRPEVASRLQQEIATAGDFSPQSLDKLDYLNRFLNEVTRIHSPLLQTRRTVTAVELGGFTIPPGIDIGYSIAAIHRNPNIFPEPNTFDPDRWDARGSGARCRSFVPFSMGNQMCIGNNYAWIALQTTLHSLLSKWEFQPVKTKKLPRALGQIPSMGRLPLEVRPVSG